MDTTKDPADGQPTIRQYTKKLIVDATAIVPRLQCTCVTAVSVAPAAMTFREEVQDEGSRRSASDHTCR